MAASPTSWLALDLATKTGWAHSNGCDGMADFGFDPGEVVGARVARAYELVDELFKRAYFENVVYEQAHHQGGPATRSALALIHGVELWCYRWRKPIYSVHTGTLKKHATGSGRAKKPDMIKAALEKWPDKEIYDDNQVDALWLLDYAENEL